MTYLETDRLYLRDLTVGDVDVLADMWADPQVTAYLGGPRNRDEVAAGLVEDALSDTNPEFDLWPVFDKETFQSTLPRGERRLAESW